jgi:hypothetical protein
VRCQQMPARYVNAIYGLFYKMLARALRKGPR